MNVSHQNTDNLNAVISIEISKADYRGKSRQISSCLWAKSEYSRIQKRESSF